MFNTILLKGFGSLLVVTMMVLQPAWARHAVAPDEHGFVFGMPDKLHPPNGGRTTNIVGDPSGSESDIHDPDNMNSVPTGAFFYQPPEGYHYDIAKDEVDIVQIMERGQLSPNLFHSQVRTDD